MSNETKNVTDVIVDSTEKVYGAVTDRIADRINQIGDDADKDKATAEKAVKAAAETAAVVLEAASDQIADALNGEKFNLKKEVERAKTTIDKMVEKADGYYEAITDRIAERMTQTEEHIQKDVEAGKQLNSELKSNIDELKNKQDYKKGTEIVSFFIENLPKQMPEKISCDIINVNNYKGGTI